MVVIKSEEDAKKIKLKKGATYLITKKTCPFCIAMKSEWRYAEQRNKNLDIYVIESKYLPYLPTNIKKQVYVYPTIIGYNGKNIVHFDGNRNRNEFSQFMRAYI